MIVDCFGMWKEQEILEIRLQELDPVVDKFVIVESDLTYLNQEKEVYGEKLKEKFPKYADKIVPVFFKSPRLQPWPNENAQRRFIKSALVDLGFVGDTVIMVGDLDEIPTRKAIQEYLDHHLGKSAHFTQQLFYLYLNAHAGDWGGTYIDQLKNIEDTQYWRIGKVHDITIDGGWHFSSCGGLDRVREKVEKAAAHTEYKHSAFLEETLPRAIRELRNPWRDRPLTILPIDEGFPEYIQQHKIELTTNGWIYNG